MWAKLLCAWGILAAGSRASCWQACRCSTHESLKSASRINPLWHLLQARVAELEAAATLAAAAAAITTSCDAAGGGGAVAAGSGSVSSPVGALAVSLDLLDL